jgi:hypothetical protein
MSVAFLLEERTEYRIKMAARVRNGWPVESFREWLAPRIAERSRNALDRDRAGAPFYHTLSPRDYANEDL